MAQPDSCPDVSNGAIIHSPVIICSELDNHREREDDEGEEEDDEVELAEEVGEDVLMMVGVEEGQVEGGNREMKVAEEVQTIQVFPLPNGVLSEESVGGGIQEENNESSFAVGQQGCESPDEQKSDKVFDEGITEEMLQETDLVLGNHCHLSPEFQVEKHEEIHLENNEGIEEKEIKEKHEETHSENYMGIEEKIGRETHLETNEGIEEKEIKEKHQETHLENNSEIEEKIDGEIHLETTEEIEEKEKHEDTHSENNTGIEEKIDGETHLETHEEINQVEEECNNHDTIMSSDTELKADNSEIADNGFEEPELSCTDEDQHQDFNCHEQESKETGQLSSDDIEATENIISDAGMTDRSEDLVLNTFADTIEEDRSINQDNDCQDSAVNDCCKLTDVTDTIEVFANHAKQQTNDHESGIKSTDDNNQSSQQNTESVIEDSSPQNNFVEAEGEDEEGKDLLQDVISEPQILQEMESEVDQMVDQVEVAVATDQEQSEATDWVKEEQIEEIGDILEEEKEQVCDHVPNLMDVREESKAEDRDTGENNVGESVFECEQEGTNDEDAPESVAPAEGKAEENFPELELQCIDDVSSESKQDVGLIPAEEDFEMEEENPFEPTEPNDDCKLEENESTTQEAVDSQEHTMQTVEETFKYAEDNSREPQRGQDLAEECMGGAGATDPFLEEPVTTLDDEFDEIEDTPTTELDDPLPESTTSPSDDQVEVKADPDGQNNEMQQDKEREAAEAVETNADDREVFLELNERVRGLKEALENGTLGVEPPPPPSSKEECRPTRVSSSKRKDDDWIKKNEQEAEKTTEVKEWKKEPKPVRKDFWEFERARKETPPPDEKVPQRKNDWITELKSVIKDESLPKRRDEQVKKKRVVLFEDGRSYFPHREETSEQREDVTLISHKKVDGPPVSPVPPVQSDDKAPQDQAYEISLYVKVKNNTYRGQTL